MNQEEQTMKTTFKKISAILASVLLAVGITACNEKEPASEEDGNKCDFCGNR